MCKHIKILMLCVAVVTIFACDHVSPVEELENLLEMDFSKKDITFINRQEQWMGPDGYKIETFNVNDHDCLSNKKSDMQQYDGTFVEKEYKGSEIYNYIKNTSGYYIKSIQDNMWEWLFYDTINYKLYYYLIII